MKSLSTINLPCGYVTNRLWRKKHIILIAIILISLIVTITYTSSDLSLPFSSQNRQSKRAPKSHNEHEKIIRSRNDFHLSQGQQIYFQPKPESVRDFNSDSKISMIKSNEKYVPEFRFVHLDLKGAPPKLSYFQKLFPLLSKAGANGILIEYEDMFPFEGDLRFATADNAYSKKDIQAINFMAQQNRLEVIPLVQTFGHLEFFLKLQQYRHLREVDQFPQAICPSKNQSIQLVTQIIDQVMALHPDSKWLHIGCDEVFHIGLCDACKMKTVATHVNSKHNVNAIIWDDMLRQFSPVSIRQYGLDKIGVEIMIWTYIDDIYRFIPYSQFVLFSEIFPNIWGASAFKGAFGETLTVPDVKMHLDNNIAWLEALREQSKNIKHVRGLVLTGWQRYDHLGTLCELLPAGLPSLILNLITVTNGKFDKELFKKFNELMDCQNFWREKSLSEDRNLFSKTICNFPGAEVFRVMKEFADINKKVNDYLYDVTIHKAWLTDYNVRHNISSPFRINEGLQEYRYVFHSVKSLMIQAAEALGEIYDNYTVYEWIEQKIYPQIIRLEKFYNNTNKLNEARVWPKRPLPPLQDLQRFIGKGNNV